MLAQSRSPRPRFLAVLELIRQCVGGGEAISGRVGVSPAGSGVPPERAFARGKRARRKMRRSAGSPQGESVRLADRMPTLPENCAMTATDFLDSR